MAHTVIIFGKPHEYSEPTGQVRFLLCLFVFLFVVTATPWPVEAALSETDKAFVAFADAFENRFIRQGEHEDRSIDETLRLGWELVALLPKVELKRIKDEYIERYMPKPAEDSETKDAKEGG